MVNPEVTCDSITQQDFVQFWSNLASIFEGKVRNRVILRYLWAFISEWAVWVAFLTLKSYWRRWWPKSEYRWMCKISRKTSPKVWFGWYWRPVHSRFWTFQNCRCQWRCENFLCRISNTTAQTWIILSKTILWYWKLNKNFLLHKMKYPYDWKDFWSNICVLRFMEKKVNKLTCNSSLKISLRVQNLLFAVPRNFTRHHLSFNRNECSKFSH